MAYGTNKNCTKYINKYGYAQAHDKEKTNVLHKMQKNGQQLNEKKKR